MAYGVLGMSPEEFGNMTMKEFYKKITGFGWQRMLAARARADIIAAIVNSSNQIASSNSKKRVGKRTRADDLCPITKPPKNIFFRQLFGLPY